MAQPFWHYGTLAAQATTDNFADFVYGDVQSKEAISIVRAYTSGPLSFMLENRHASNGIDYRILGTNDLRHVDADWAIVTASTGLAALAKVEVTLSLAYYIFYKVQIKATTPSAQGSVEGNACHKRV